MKKSKTKLEKILFNKYPVWVVKDEDGGVIWINLHNICHILKRKEMMDNGTARDLCKNTIQHPMYGNGKLFWFTKISDILNITRKVRTDSSLAAGICNEVEEWLTKLPIGREAKPEKKTKEEAKIKIIIPPKNGEHKTSAFPKNKNKDDIQGAREGRISDTNSLIVRQYEDQQISFKAENGMTYTNATEMARKYGKNPREWLLLADTLRFRQSLVEQGITPTLDSQIMTRRGTNGATYLEQHVAVEFARWLDPNFAIWINKTNQELIEQGFVVLQQNSLQTTNSIDEILERFGVPQTKSEALLLAAAYAKKIEEDKPKVEYYERMVGERDEFTSSQIALELNISTIQLHKFLVEERIVMYRNRRYEVYPNHYVLQKDHPYMWTNKLGKTYAYSRGKRWTKVGREFIIELYLEKNKNI